MILREKTSREEGMKPFFAQALVFEKIELENLSRVLEYRRNENERFAILCIYIFTVYFQRLERSLIKYTGCPLIGGTTE